MYALNIEAHADYLRVTVDGVLDRTTDALIDDDVARACEQGVARSVLIDIRAASGRLSVLENHEAASTFRGRIGAHVRRVAVLDLPEHAARSAMFELTARNRGAMVRFFSDERAAVDWLCR